MEGALLMNGLECKLSCGTSKVSYVLDTEDWFHRQRQKEGKRTIQQGRSVPSAGEEDDVRKLRARRKRKLEEMTWFNDGVTERNTATVAEGDAKRQRGEKSSATTVSMMDR
eukprot:TRINITY_DN6218_c0_g1_i1.p1 TRINITY_DN6218_c0_g1~~TRINITY_DN6218_c0_g1_i1.p1  ORF type:complete len:126 (-),score=31.88 TRINITY_DN6218_c0_g1_i1:189-521(-)